MISHQSSKHFAPVISERDGGCAAVAKRKCFLFLILIDVRIYMTSNKSESKGTKTPRVLVHLVSQNWSRKCDVNPYRYSKLLLPRGSLGFGLPSPMESNSFCMNED
jgi:hypothetical protein